MGVAATSHTLLMTLHIDSLVKIFRSRHCLLLEKELVKNIGNKSYLRLHDINKSLVGRELLE